MAYSSILGAETAPVNPEGRDSRLLGPSDNSDSGSDTLGTSEAHADSDAQGTGERGSVSPDEGREGADILPDRVVNMKDGEVDADDSADQLTDLDADAADLDPDEA